MDDMDSNIQSFFRNKTVFLTGGTGFLGKVFIEKLLRTTEVSQVYLLTRPKAGIDISERFEQMFKDAIFDKLRAVHPDPMKLITPISGDCTQRQLGISDEDRKVLIEQVNVVMHSAATVRFNEPLSNATQINLQATVDLMDLAKEMKQLNAFVHVSSAFANCLVFDSEERYYTEYLGTTSDKVLSIKNALGDDKLNEMETELLGKFPNTYCYTKALAEDAVLKYGSVLPLCVFRPGIILPTAEDPIPGWVDSLYGPMSILYGCAYGVLRVMFAKENYKAALIPVDYCANVMLASAWHTATAVKQIPSKDPIIYTFTPDESNTLKWGDYKKYVKSHGSRIPLTSMIWYPFLIFASSLFAYNFWHFVYHILPGYVIDFVLRIMGRKPRMIKAYKKIRKQCMLLQHFCLNEFSFDITNTKNLFKIMTPEDREMFNFDMATLNWDKYFYNSLFGLRRFMAKEEPESVPQAKKLLTKLYFLHCVVHAVVFTGLGWMLWAVFKYSMLT